MELTIKVNREDWNRFILENSGSFLQSWEWGEFQESVGRRVFRLAVPPSSAGADLGPLRHSSSEASEAMPAQFIENTIPVIKKKYWYCPKGPTMSRTIRGQEFRDRIKDLIDEIKKNSPPNVIFFRLGPEWEIGQGIEKNLENLGFKKLHYDIEPSQTLILDLNKTEEELLAQMHEKWRYNIRLAERKGVKIKMATSQDANFEKYFEEFYKLVDEGTSARKEIKHHPKEYYRKQFLIEGKNPPQPSLKGGSDSPPLGGVRGDLKMVLFVAEYENKVIAANIIVFSGRRATYLHGATSSEHREVMAPHLLQWEQIRYAKNRGCSQYDFWGIVNEHTIDKRGKSWEGFTRFKKGFGGREVNYIGYWDYPINKAWYWLYRLAQSVRR